MSAQYDHAASPIPIVPVLTDTATARADAPATSKLATLRQEAALLRERQQHDFEALRAEIAAEFSALQAAITAAPQDDDSAAPDAEADSSPHLTSRRTLLKWGGVGAAAALAAVGGASLSMPTAHAADGFPLILGNSTNTAEDLTHLTYDGAETKPTAFKVSIGDNGLAINGNAGNYNTAGPTNLYGPAGVAGFAGTGANAVGVTGKAGSNGTGVYGVAKGDLAWGTWGSSDTGVGVQGVSGTGIDLAAGDSGRLLLVQSAFPGAPTGGTYSIGEQIRDANGNLLICITSGTPGTWVKAASVAPGAGGFAHLLSAPIRLLDTRTSGAYGAGSTHVIQITGVSIGTISIPKGATGVIGNVTVVRPNGGGDLRLYPGGAGAPSTSSINFAAGDVIANGVTVGLSSSGQMSIKVDMPAGTSTNILFDASGYVM